MKKYICIIDLIEINITNEARPSSILGKQILNQSQWTTCQPAAAVSRTIIMSVIGGVELAPAKTVSWAKMTAAAASNSKIMDFYFCFILEVFYKQLGEGMKVCATKVLNREGQR